MHGVEFILILLPLMIQKLGSMAFAYSFSHTQLKTNEQCCIFRAKQRNLKSCRLFTAIASSPYCCLHISWAAHREYWFDNQDILKLVIISSILLTLMFDSGVTLWGEIRWSHSSKVRERFCAVCWCSSWLVPLSTRVGQIKDCLRVLSYRSVFLWLFFYVRIPPGGTNFYGQSCHWYISWVNVVLRDIHCDFNEARIKTDQEICPEAKSKNLVTVFFFSGKRRVSLPSTPQHQSESTFSILFSIHFWGCWQGEFVKQSRTSSAGDHFLNSLDLRVWFRGDIVRRN